MVILLNYNHFMTESINATLEVPTTMFYYAMNNCSHKAGKEELR